jgi:hypothetical protein
MSTEPACAARVTDDGDVVVATDPIPDSAFDRDAVDVADDEDTAVCDFALEASIRAICSLAALILAEIAAIWAFPAGVLAETHEVQSAN